MAKHKRRQTRCPIYTGRPLHPTCNMITGLPLSRGKTRRDAEPDLPDAHAGTIPVPHLDGSVRYVAIKPDADGLHAIWEPVACGGEVVYERTGWTGAPPPRPKSDEEQIAELRHDAELAKDRRILHALDRAVVEGVKARRRRKNGGKARKAKANAQRERDRIEYTAGVEAILRAKPHRHRTWAREAFAEGYRVLDGKLSEAPVQEQINLRRVMDLTPDLSR
jgi:hypothetical protein